MLHTTVRYYILLSGGKWTSACENRYQSFICGASLIFFKSVFSTERFISVPCDLVLGLPPTRWECRIPVSAAQLLPLGHRDSGGAMNYTSEVGIFGFTADFVPWTCHLDPPVDMLVLCFLQTYHHILCWFGLRMLTICYWSDVNANVTSLLATNLTSAVNGTHHKSMSMWWNSYTGALTLRQKLLLCAPNSLSTFTSNHNKLILNS